MVRSLVVLIALALIAPAIAQADPSSDAKAKWRHGQSLYDLGKYAEAIKEFEAAYELDPDPAYLFASAQANRLANNYDRAIDLFKRYNDLAPDDPKHADILAAIDEMQRAKADKAVADRAAADKALADKIAADKAEADRLAAEAAAKKASGENKHLRISVEAGVSLIHLQGFGKTKSPALGGRLGGFYTRRYGANTYDIGGIWQITSFPFERTDLGHEMENAAVFYTQLHGYGAVTRMLAGPVWGRLGVGLGFSAFANLKQGNPISKNMIDEKDIRMLCARIDALIGLRYSPTIDFVLGLGSASYSPRNDELTRPEIKGTTTLEGAYLGVYVKI